MDAHLSDIISKLEAASGPDREIDGTIALSLNQDAKLWTPEWWSGGRDEFIRWPDPKPGEARYEQVEHYTSSIDAALSLVPEGHDLQLFEDERGWKARLIRRADRELFAPFEGLKFPVERRAVNGALAISEAALRARAHKGEG